MTYKTETRKSGIVVITLDNYIEDREFIALYQKLKAEYGRVQVELHMPTKPIEPLEP